MPPRVRLPPSGLTIRSRPLSTPQRLALVSHPHPAARCCCHVAQARLSRQTNLTLLASRTQPQRKRVKSRTEAVRQRRSYSDEPAKKPESWKETEAQHDGQHAPSEQTDHTGAKDTGAAEEPKGPNMDQLPHVTEEAAAMRKIQGKTPPDINQGTPVQEILKKDSSIPGKRSFSTSSISHNNVDTTTVTEDQSMQQLAESVADMELGTMGASATTEVSTELTANETDDEGLDFLRNGFGPLPPGYTKPTGTKFGLPTLPLPPRSHLKHRYDPVVDQITRLMMEDGKLARAQQWMTQILTHLRTAPPPILSASHPLLKGHPPAEHLPLHPTLYLTLALDSVAPLLRIRSQRGAAGGGVALQIPVPLTVRQRRRVAAHWILDAAKAKGPEKGGFAQRVALEVVAIVEGKSSVWVKRQGVHRIATGARANLAAKRRSGRR